MLDSALSQIKNHKKIDLCFKMIDSFVKFRLNIYDLIMFYPTLITDPILEIILKSNKCQSTDLSNLNLANSKITDHSIV